MHAKIKYFLPHWIGWLILLKGIINIGFGLIAFFSMSSILKLPSIHVLVMFWDFSPLKSLTALLLGMGYIFLGRGLYLGKRLAWITALFWLCLNLLDSLLPHIILFQALFNSILILILGMQRHAFTTKTSNPLRPQQTIAFVSLIFVLAYGIIGCYLLRTQYQGIHTWTDAIYYSLETYSTIGYGDILPITQHAKVFTSSMIIMGVGVFIAAVSILLGPVVETRMKKVIKMVNTLNIVQNHIIIAGAGHFGLQTAKALQKKGLTIILSDQDKDRLKIAEDFGFKTVQGDPAQEEILKYANFNGASAFISMLESDAENLLATMVAQHARTKSKAKIKIIICIDNPENSNYAKQNGADEIINPNQIFGEIIAEAVAK